MRISKKELRKIIKEEIEAVALEEFVTLDDLTGGYASKAADWIKDKIGKKPSTPAPAGGMSKGPARSDGGGMTEPVGYQTPAQGEKEGGFDTIYPDEEFEQARGEDSMKSILNKVGGMKNLLKLKYNHPLRAKYRKLYSASKSRRKPAKPAKFKSAKPQAQQDLSPRTRSQVERYNAGQARVNLERLKGLERRANARGKAAADYQSATSLAATVLKDTPPGVAKDAVRKELTSMGFDVDTLAKMNPRVVPGKPGGKESLKTAAAGLGGEVR